MRYINVFETTAKGVATDMLVADGVCSLFVSDGASPSKISWYAFDSRQSSMQALFQQKMQSDAEEFVFEPEMKFTSYPIVGNGWTFKMLNRDFSSTSVVSDAFAIHCKNGEQDLWYVPLLDAYIYGATSAGPVKDMAYEQNGDRLYVLFEGDNHIYAYDNIGETKKFGGFIVLVKETATMKLVTFNSMQIGGGMENFYLLLDYYDDEWKITIYGGKNVEPKAYNAEYWDGNPGQNKNGYRQYNTIVFGDSLFSEGQLRFHNISKNKDMYDIIDVSEVDGRYYGLFENKELTLNGRPTYAVFKAEPNGGVVHRLPWVVLN